MSGYNTNVPVPQYLIISEKMGHCNSPNMQQKFSTLNESSYTDVKTSGRTLCTYIFLHIVNSLRKIS